MSTGNELAIRDIVSKLLEICEIHQSILNEYFDELEMHSSDDLDLVGMLSDCDIRIDQIKKQIDNNLYVTNDKLSANWDAYRYK